MKRLALIAALALTSGSCEFAHNHPAVTAGIAGGFIGLVPCLPAVSEPFKCVEIGAAVGVGLGGFVGLVNLLFDTSAHDLTPPPQPSVDPDAEPEGTTTPPPPGPPPGSPLVPTAAASIDAGVIAVDAPVDSTPAD